MHSYDLEGRGRVVVALLRGQHLFRLAPPYRDGHRRLLRLRGGWSVPSYAAFYSVLHWVFDRYVWRFGLLENSDFCGFRISTAHGSAP